MSLSKKLISIFTPVYNEEQNLELVYQQAKEIMTSVSDRYDYEHVFSDNASTDHSYSILKRLRAHDQRIKLIKLSRNFGCTKSTLNGLYKCRGDAIVQIDADLQDPPEMIPEFLAKWEAGYKVVYGVRKDRDEFWLMKYTRKAFYRIAANLSGETLIPDVGEFRLIDRRIVTELKKTVDYNPYLRGQIANMGFAQVGIPYRRRARKYGKSSNNLFLLIDYGINGVVSHSKALLRISTMTGFVLAVGAFAAAALYLILRVVYPETPRGIASIMIFILFFSGIQMIFLGIIGEYVAKILDQSLQKPLVIEEELVGFDESAESLEEQHASLSR